MFCSQCGEVNAGRSLRLLKSQCDGSGESRRKARRRTRTWSDAGRASSGRCETRCLKCLRTFFSVTMLDVMTHRASSVRVVIKKIQRFWAWLISFWKQCHIRLRWLPAFCLEGSSGSSCSPPPGPLCDHGRDSAATCKMRPDDPGGTPRNFCLVCSSTLAATGCAVLVPSSIHSHRKLKQLFFLFWGG